MLDKTKSATANIVQRCEDLFTDLNFEAAPRWPEREETERCPIETTY